MDGRAGVVAMRERLVGTGGWGGVSVVSKGIDAAGGAVGGGVGWAVSWDLEVDRHGAWGRTLAATPY